jgi:hypothetical protein
MRLFDKREGMEDFIRLNIPFHLLSWVQDPEAFDEYYQEALDSMKNEIQMIRPRRWVALEKVWDKNAAVMDKQAAESTKRKPNLSLRAVVRQATFPSPWERFKKLSVEETCPTLLAHIKELEFIKSMLEKTGAPEEKILNVDNVIEDFQIIIVLIDIREVMQSYSGKTLIEHQDHFDKILKALNELLDKKNTLHPKEDFFNDIFEKLLKNREEKFLKVLKKHVSNLLSDIFIGMKNIQPMDSLVRKLFESDQGPRIVKEYAEDKTHFFRNKNTEVEQSIALFDSVGLKKLLSEEVQTYQRYLLGIQKLMLNYGALAELSDVEGAHEAIQFIENRYTMPDFPDALILALSRVAEQDNQNEEVPLKKWKGMSNQ